MGISLKNTRGTPIDVDAGDKKKKDGRAAITIPEGLSDGIIYDIDTGIKLYVFCITYMFICLTYRARLFICHWFANSNTNVDDYVIFLLCKLPRYKKIDPYEFEHVEYMMKNVRLF